MHTELVLEAQAKYVSPDIVGRGCYAIAAQGQAAKAPLRSQSYVNATQNDATAMAFECMNSRTCAEGCFCGGKTKAWHLCDEAPQLLFETHPQLITRDYRERL